MSPWDLPTQPLQPISPLVPLTEEGGTQDGCNRILDDVREWLARFVTVVDDVDLDLLALWAAHTHVVVETYTTPRLVIDSPVPGSGKTTVLEHLERLCEHPIQMASISSPALLTRMLDKRMRTILIDEADRALSPKRDGVDELLAVLNSGYKRGGTRPVLVPTKDGWDASEMPTYSPVAMAGNSPDLPEDTKSRSIRVLLMPDIDGVAEESDWEIYDEEARELGTRLAEWADIVREEIKIRPTLPEGVKGRARERWGPLKRVAVAIGGRWPETVDRLAVEDVARLEGEKDDGIAAQRPHLVLLTHIHRVWPEGESFIGTELLISKLIDYDRHMWGEFSSYGKALTSHRLAKMLGKFRIAGARPDPRGPRGYLRVGFDTAFSRFGMTPSVQVAQAARPAQVAIDEATS